MPSGLVLVEKQTAAGAAAGGNGVRVRLQLLSILDEL